MRFAKLDLDDDRHAPISPYTELLTVPEAAERLRVHPVTVRKWVAARQIEAVRLGRRTLIKATAVEDYIASHTHQPVTSRRGKKK